MAKKHNEKPEIQTYQHQYCKELLSLFWKKNLNQQNDLWLFFFKEKTCDCVYYLKDKGKKY